jgi:hypothetical protein
MNPWLPLLNVGMLVCLVGMIGCGVVAGWRWVQGRWSK